MRVKILPDDDRSFLIGASVKDEERVEMLLFLVQKWTCSLGACMRCLGWTPSL